MLNRLGRLSLFLLVACCFSWAQDSGTPVTATKTDYSHEASVVELISQKEKFENDGTSSSETVARVRIQSEAGVQTYGVLNFPYAAGTSTLTIDYVRVRKPDGSVVETPAENIQDMTSQITREAPFYSDLHEKHVAVKALGVGDVLEYRALGQTTKPLATGQFWTAYEFTHEVIVLDEKLEISVPKDREIKFKSPKIAPAITEAGSYRVYAWHSTSLQHKDDSDKRQATEKLWQQARGRLPLPDVLLSSFSRWEDVGSWYGALQEDRVKPSAEVIAKATELTKTASDDDAKLHAIYDYVSQQFHYIGIAFGIGRYQPHSAEAVLENQYGDCKDKHTLLASLLSAVGIPAYPALISSSRQLDPDVPSPGQFDHVITIVPRPSGTVWLDTTAEVGPYQYLVPALRGKQTLAIWKDRPAALVGTPPGLPYPTTQTFNMEGKLNDAGVMEGSGTYSARGDVEYFLRAGFRVVPLPQWKELGQRISFSLGFSGDVSEVTASSPEKTDEAFHFAYHYKRKDFGDWPNKRIVAPEPMVSLPAPADGDRLPMGPIWIGEPSEISFHSQLELPSGYRPELPAAIHVKHDFAEFDATEQFKDGKLISERHVKTLMREVPAGEREAYKEFAKAVQDEYGVFIPLLSGPNSASAPIPPSQVMSMIERLRNLPDSPNSEAARLEGEARTAMTNRDLQTVVSSLYRAVAADPKFARAWLELGHILPGQAQIDAALEAYHKAIAAAPDEPAVPKNAAFSLMSLRLYAEAASIWQDYIKAHPDDVDGPTNLGNCLMALKKYSDAAAAYESAVKIDGSRSSLEASLGSAYLQADEREKATAAFKKMSEMNPDKNSLNNVAYQMAGADLELPFALQYAQKAVRETEDESAKITLSTLSQEDLRRIFTLSAYWDTLGWVNERMSNFGPAEQYLLASWKLTQDGVVAGHLCHLYRRTHQTAAGIQMCRLAIARIPMSSTLALDEYEVETKAAEENLSHMTGGTKSPTGPAPSDIVIHERTFNLPRFLPGTESAEFFLLFSSDATSKEFKVSDVKFISGSDKMKNQGKQVINIHFKFSAPDGSASRFVKRGILGCYQYSGCSFVLLDQASVQSLN